MRVLKTLSSGIKTFMILFSFVVNLILLIVVVVLALTLFDIKNNIVTPLVTGLHSSFVGLNEATIDWTIPVRDSVPIQLNIPLAANTVVSLTEAVPLTVRSNIILPGVGELNNVIVQLELPEGLALPVALNLNVPVSETLDIALDVRAVIPVGDTQLHDPIENLRLTFEPIARVLHNLPDDYGVIATMMAASLFGAGPDLLAENDYSRRPWPGFSRTAGVGYTLGNEPVPIGNQPLLTGIVPIGGIPALDERIRPEIYALGRPQEINLWANLNMMALGIPSVHFDGSYAEQRRAQFAAEQLPAPESNVEPGTLRLTVGDPAAQPPLPTAIMLPPAP
ncbi:MAG: hypothetical protein SNJ59_09035 [Aggregatilineales bacterium]